MIWLASTSPRRQKMLRDLGVRFRAISPDYEERPIRGVSPARLVRTHALGKAVSAARRVADGTILSADTVVYFKGRVIGKPRNMAHARRTLSALQGKWHRVYTGVAVLVVAGGRERRRRLFSEVTRVRLKPMDAAAIAAYFKKVDPLDKAGAYAIQTARHAVVAEVRGSFSNAVGLPVERLKGLMRRGR